MEQKTINWGFDLQSAWERARSEQRFVLADFARDP
jgi:hypothetical protein